MYMNDGNKTKINLKNKSVFITGVAGFIGSNLAKRLLSTVEDLSKASVTSYLPYKKGVYFRENCEREQISVVAEGLRRMRQRKKAVEVLQSSHDEQNLWKCIVAFQGYRFKTISGMPFSYKIRTGRNGELTKELWIDRRESSKSLTWSSILLAFEKTKGKPLVERPKALGDIHGVSYIYGMFSRFGLIEVPVKQDKLRSNPAS